MGKTKKFMAGLVLGLAVVAFISVTGASAANYPKKPINVIQGFKPGGGTDALAQLTQPFLEKTIGTTFINQYLPGATGAIAWTKLTKSARKDGYTISITNTPMFMTNYIMNKEIKYNISDLTPIANVVTDPAIIVVGKDSPYKTAKEFFDAARTAPNSITAGNSGIGGDDFFATLTVEKESGLKFKKIPFQGDGPSWQAAMGGEIDASFNNLGITYPQIKAGNLIPLVVFSEERNPNLPNVPTLKELGYEIVAGSSRGYCAPKGISEATRETLVKAFRSLSDNLEFKQAAEERALVLDLRFGDEYGDYLQYQENTFGHIWNEVKDQYTH